MRHDSVLIKHVHKLYGRLVAEGLQSLPFFYIDNDTESHFADYTQRNENGFKKQYPEFVVSLLDYEGVEHILPFRRFVIMDHDIGWHSVKYEGGGRWRILMCIDRMLQDMGLAVPPGALFSYKIAYHPVPDITNQYDLEIDAMILLNSDTGRLDGLSMDMQRKFTSMSTHKEFLKEVGKHISTNLQYFLSFFKWAEGLHMVEVRKKPDQEDLKQKNKGYKKPWLRKDLPHYVYLDAPKTVQDGKGTYESNDPTHSVRGHNRRAHWRTLTNPRFKKHPMYGKRIRVRSTWVGPTEWSVGDTIYTVKGEHNVSDRASDRPDTSNEGAGAAREAQDTAY